MGDLPRPLTIGLPFKNHKDWIGGVYYVRNIVSALALLPESERPRIVVISEDSEAANYLFVETAYPGLRRASPGDIAAVSFDSEEDTGREGEIDVILLGSLSGLESRSIRWVADFQEERFPQFFPDAVLKWRLRNHAQSFSTHRHVMVSSEDVRRDLERYYGSHANRVHVVNFASFVDVDLAQTDAAALRSKYSLPDRFFLCSNQLFRHKNHNLVLQALEALDPQEPMPPVVFTGQEHDYRDPGYAPSIKALGAGLIAAKRARFLGFLPRADQLGLMAQSIAVVQPSLCEGWSTVIEDAKALGRYVLASDIAVHREQIDCNVDFFQPDDHHGLLRLLGRHRDVGPQVVPVDYSLHQHRFARSLLNMIKEADRDFRERRVSRLHIIEARQHLS